MTLIRNYPEFTPIDLDMRDELYRLCADLTDGHCEVLFASMYLYRQKYRYRISRLAEGTYVLAGFDAHFEQNRGSGAFFSLFGRMPPADAVLPLFDVFHAWKQMPSSWRETLGSELEKRGYTVAEDRDNFDYLYLRTDLAALGGKKLHKKKNLLNAFNAAYPASQVRPLSAENAGDAQAVLDAWRDSRGALEVTDYDQCTEALALLDALSLDGVIAYVEGKPVAFTIGETMAGGAMYCVHFEKGRDEYKGVFQFINQASALALGEGIVHVNREQDVGDEGLRQAKMTYRPEKFVVKYLVTR